MLICIHTYIHTHIPALNRFRDYKGLILLKSKPFEQTKFKHVCRLKPVVCNFLWFWALLPIKPINLLCTKAQIMLGACTNWNIIKLYNIIWNIIYKLYYDL